MNNTNEEYIKNYLTSLGKSVQEDLEEISKISWNSPHVFIKLGELTKSLREAKDSSKNFLEYLRTEKED